MSWPRLPQEAKACNFSYLFNINEGLVLLKLADTVLILINTLKPLFDGVFFFDNIQLYLKAMKYQYSQVLHEEIR